MIESCDLLVTNATVLTMDDRGSVLEDAGLAVTGTTIVAVEPSALLQKRYRAGRVIDAEGAAVHPGFIDSHTHTNGHLMRTRIPDRPGADATRFFIDAFNALTDEDEHAAGLLACLELARNGYTALMEPGTVFETDALVSAAARVGVRVSVADPFVWDAPEFGFAMASALPRAPATRARTQATLGRELARRRDPLGLAHAHVSVYGGSSCSFELIAEAKRMATAQGAAFHMHQSMSRPDSEDRRAGMPIALKLRELGVLDRRTSLTHMNVIREPEQAALVESGVVVNWVPANHLYYAIGASAGEPYRLPGLIERGLDAALAVDVAKAWTFGDMPRIAYLAAREAGSSLSAELLMRLSTRGGAKAMGLWDELGSLEPGKRADIVIRRADLPEAVPGADPYVTAMLLSGSKSIRSVICNGAIILDDGGSTTVDEAEVYALARGAARGLARRIA